MNNIPDFHLNFIGTTSEESGHTISPKDCLIDFVKKTSDEVPYQFQLPGDEPACERYIQCMRSELSRLRTKIKQQGRQPLHFKIFKKEISCVDGVCTITLVRSNKKPLSENIQEMLDVLSI